MRHRGKKNQKDQNPSRNYKPIAEPPKETVCAAFQNPITVKIEPNPNAASQYTEQKNNRTATLATAKALNWITAIAMLGGLISVVLLYENLLAAIKQVGLMQAQFTSGQRAWITISQVTPVSPTADFPVAISFRNVGKSPAFRTVVTAEAEIINSSESASLKRTDFELTAHVLFPDGHQEFPAWLVNEDQTRKILDSSEIEGLLSGVKYVTIFGEAVYTDQFGKHWTRFCAWRTYSSALKAFNSQSCVEWNAVGDGDPPKSRQPVTPSQ